MRSKSWKRSNELITPRRIERPALLTRIVAAAVLLQHARDERVARRDVGDVGRCRSTPCRPPLDLGLRLEELLLAARDEDHLRAGVGELQRRRLADARRRAGDDDHLVLDAAGERAVDEEIRVEVALPVVPELRRVGLERRHLDAGALERLRRLAVVVARRPVDELEHVARDAEVGQHDPDRALDRRERAEAVEDRRRDEAEHLRVDAHRHLRRVAGVGEDVEHLADPVRLGIGQVEALAVEPLLVREVVERVGDEVHRHDVDAAALDADHRHPRRQRCRASSAAS